MAHVDYATAKKNVVIGLGLLAAITLVEVGLSLFVPNMFGKLLILCFSIYKAYYIMWKFMHLGEEAKVLKFAIVLPFILLAWGLIAFLQEGNAWRTRRAKIVDPIKMEEFNHKGDYVPKHGTHDSGHEEHH